MKSLISGGRFCSFSPCIEQVQRTCEALTQHGFQDISTMEVLQTELKVSRRTVPVRDLTFLKQKVLQQHKLSNEPAKQIKIVNVPLRGELCNESELTYCRVTRKS
ncbi:unnamed protein product [Pieris macdunnoughi]|uniref:tRNA (adenine(58)-N(1))-methyltransferase n=1 Tax=Pieris macdunnoughi TaxID=345717 RepID=A0A821RH05_9NEOP|nr:unnamed protein product [Pieris macdunnoughi]